MIININNRGQLGQIITSPFILIFVVILMSVYVFLVATVFDITSGIDKSEFVSAEGIISESVKERELLYEEGNFAGRKMFLSEAILLKFSGNLRYYDFQTGLEDIFMRLNDGNDMCLGIAYDIDSKRVWKTRNTFEIGEEGVVHEEVIKKESYGAVLSGKTDIEFNYFPFEEVNNSYLNKRVSLFYEGEEIYLSYFYEDCWEIMKDE